MGSVMRRLDVPAAVAHHEGVALEDLNEWFAHRARAVTSADEIGAGLADWCGGPGKTR